MVRNCWWLVPFALAGCADAPAPPFASKVDGFEVRFGAEPRFNERALEGSRSAVYTVEGPDGARTVAVTDVPLTGDEPADFAARVLDTAAADVLKAGEGEAVSKANATLAGKYPGREFVARVAKPKAGMVRARLWFANGKLYQVFVLGTDGFVKSDAATTFLDSFQVRE